MKDELACAMSRHDQLKARRIHFSRARQVESDKVMGVEPAEEALPPFAHLKNREIAFKGQRRI